MTDAKPTYAAGELIDITIRGARVRGYYGAAGALNNGEPTDLMVTYGGASDLNLDLGAEGVTVERMAPVEWPPLVGDLWRDRADNLWFGTPNSHDADLWLIGATGQGDHASSLLRLCGPLTLVHREPQPADTEDGQS